MDPLQLTIGDPALSALGHLPIAEAAALAGLEVVELLRVAADGQLALFLRFSGLDGHVISEDDCDVDQDANGRSLIVPTAEQMPDLAVRAPFFGVVKLRSPAAAAESLMAGSIFTEVLFDVCPPSWQRLAPVKPHEVITTDLEVSTTEVELLRRSLAAGVTAAQLTAARARARVQAGLPASVPKDLKSQRPISEAIAPFMVDRSSKCAPDQAARVRSACELFVELCGDPKIGDITRDMLRDYRDHKLPSVPSNENQIRLKFSTTSVTESIEKVSGSSWPKISPAEVVKRVQWLTQLFQWMKQESWTVVNLAEGISKSGVAVEALHNMRKVAGQTKRDPFTDEEIKRIFSQSWYSSGKGELTKEGTYREFSPHYYWMPLIGLYTGARINEIAQLGINDLTRTAGGAWYFAFTEEEEGRELAGDRKKLKNTQSIRKVPIHPHLVELGLLDWRRELEGQGRTRLFPELKRNATKGHGKSVTKWFSRMLKGFGWIRNGKKVFHSFRHTLANQCALMGMSDEITRQISGHERGTGTLRTVYMKDLPPELMTSVSCLEFSLPHIAKFDLVEGSVALQDALRRKNRGRGEAPADTPA